MVAVTRNETDWPVLTLETLQETEEFGNRLGRMVMGGDVILLCGELGAGKTTLTRFIAGGLDVLDAYAVTSPSFALLHEYPGRLPLYHIDCYRLSGEDDVEGAGLADYIQTTHGVTVIEWPDRLGRLLPDERLEIHIRPTDSEKRAMIFKYFGETWNDRIEHLIHET
jgi:tRNA threonylcarbamoyladenosine biosynthesis protein TsaE